MKKSDARSIALDLVRSFSSVRLRMDGIYSVNGLDSALWTPALRAEHLELFLEELRLRDAIVALGAGSRPRPRKAD